ncbi:hypothetical protein F652_1119 [Enterobacteriaceae bacterium bta3-1]|nr:hypothetical protein F652_1119 [Enterobacteriaceae bacterium bta3-1]
MQLIDGTSGVAIKVGDNSQLTNNSYVSPNSDGVAKLPYFVEYYKIGTAIYAGLVTSKVTYTLMYK